MHLRCDITGLLIVLKKSMLKLVNEVCPASPLHVKFFMHFARSSFTLGKLSMKLSKSSPKLETQSLIVHASYFSKSPAEIPKSDSQVKMMFQA